MNRTATLLAFVTISAACGGGQPPPAPPPSSPAPAASEAPAAASSSAAPSASEAAPASSAALAASAAAAPSAAPAAGGGPPEAPGPGQWDSWSKDQKLAYMKSAVMPKMGPLFHDFNAKAFPEPKCTMCHGAGAKDGSFKMPNPALPKLPATPEGFRKLHDKNPKAVEFMSKTVVPTMAALVGEEPYDPKTQKGFGCFECHTKK